MIRTIIRIVITLALIVGISIYDIYYVQNTFRIFHEELRTLKQKTELEEATYSDGLAVRSYWDTKKQIMHICPARFQILFCSRCERFGCLIKEHIKSNVLLKLLVNITCFIS